MGGKFVLFAGAALLISGATFLFLQNDSISPATATAMRMEIPRNQPNSPWKQSWTYPANARTEDFFSPKTTDAQDALNKYYQKHPEILVLRKHVSELRSKLYRRQVELQGELPPEEYAKITKPLTADEEALEHQILIPAIIMGLMSSPTAIGSETIGSISTDLLNNTDYLEIVRPGFAEQVRRRFNDPKTAEEIANSKSLFEFGRLMGPYVDVWIDQPEDESEGADFPMERRLLKAMEELEWNYTRSFTEDIPQ